MKKFSLGMYKRNIWYMSIITFIISRNLSYKMKDRKAQNLLVVGQFRDYGNYGMITQ
uniref:Uncharacterized protein n=1 Tax=Lepeophtheirus salmonis TaxID=72036 RepID=A0A0K2U3C9_LEPSM